MGLVTHVTLLFCRAGLPRPPWGLRVQHSESSVCPSPACPGHGLGGWAPGGGRLCLRVRLACESRAEGTRFEEQAGPLCRNPSRGHSKQRSPGNRAHSRCRGSPVRRHATESFCNSAWEGPAGLSSPPWNRSLPTLARGCMGGQECRGQRVPGKRVRPLPSPRLLVAGLLFSLLASQ